MTPGRPAMAAGAHPDRQARRPIRAGERGRTDQAGGARMEAGAARCPRGGCDNRRIPERLQVQRAVAPSTGEIFAVLTDSRGHVAIDSSGMLMQASRDIVTKV